MKRRPSASFRLSSISGPVVDNNISPVGWYLGSYVLRFVELQDPKREEPEAKFLTWQNTVLVKAEDLDQAYDKVAAIGKEHTNPYKGGPDGVDVKWEFEGVSSLVPVYEEIEDGCEIAWTEHAPRKLRTIKAQVGARGSFHQRPKK
jgi:hypothetical protein